MSGSLAKDGTPRCGSERTKLRRTSSRSSRAFNVAWTYFAAIQFCGVHSSLMNRAILHSAKGRGFDSWRPFQVGFLLQALPFLSDPTNEVGVVDTVWFATGGGKTETYLGLLVTTALHDRLTGKVTGVSAWSRFPLRMLSLQQTQRFAEALAGAELARRAEGIEGAPISLGFYVGSSSTPNRIPVEAREGSPDPDDESMPERYKVLRACPFCGRTRYKNAHGPTTVAANA